MQRTIDLNCDLGEGAGHDAELMPLVTSANIACGGHAGTLHTMHAAVTLAKRHGVGVGAHPGFDDRKNFGRKELKIRPHDAARDVIVQHELLQYVTEAIGVPLRHLKLHGALYHMAARDEKLAMAIVGRLIAIPRRPILVVPAGSVFERVAREWRELEVVSEAFADRTYQPDGSLTPRSRPDALITDEETAVAQVLRMIRDGVVRATDGTDVPIRADTVCLHGDGPHAVAFACRLNRELREAGIAIKPFSA